MNITLKNKNWHKLIKILSNLRMNYKVTTYNKIKHYLNSV